MGKREYYFWAQWKKKEKLKNKHILLVDDIVTTGATLEACMKEILKSGNVKISIATISYA